MTDHHTNKALIAAFCAEVADTAQSDLPAVLAKYCHEQVQWEIFHPFNTIHGIDDAATQLWGPLKESFPDYELRLGFGIGGSYEEHDFVSTLGHLMGSFEHPWLGIPSTAGLTFLRFGVNAIVVDGKISKMYILLDVIDVMRQAGFYPLRRMPGSAEQWPMPPASSGANLRRHEPDLGSNTLRIIREMQTGLAQGEELNDLAAARTRHSPHWHRNMNWYGVAGIGSSRGQRGFLDYHGALFIQAFPDRSGIRRDPHGPQDGPGHYIKLGDGHFAVTSGWPSLYGTHLGAGWLGMAPTGTAVQMRVADWYRTDADHLIIDNWVMIDTLHILHQMGYDLLEDLRYFADPMLPRWPR